VKKEENQTEQQNTQSTDNPPTLKPLDYRLNFPDLQVGANCPPTLYLVKPENTKYNKQISNKSQFTKIKNPNSESDPA